MSSTENTQPDAAKKTEAKPDDIPAWQLGVNGKDAARIMGCSRSAFFQRVKDGMYPKPARDGLWNVSQLRECREQLAQPA